MATQTFIGYLVDEECPSCGMFFGVTSDFQRRRREDGKSFRCPNGHSQSYSKPEIERLREKLAVRERRIEYLNNDLAYTNNQVRAQKAAKTRLINRIKNGVCPCCNRSFKNVRRHMKSQHPDFKGSTK